MADIHSVRPRNPWGREGNLILTHDTENLPPGENLGGGEVHPGHSWVIEPSISWSKRCDNCQRWFLRQKFYEVYDEHGWWWECPDCLITTITAAAEDWARERPLLSFKHSHTCNPIPIDPERTEFACARCGDPMPTPAWQTEEIAKTRGCCGTLEKILGSERPELRCSECGKRLLLTTHTDDAFQEIYKLWWIDSPEGTCYCSDTITQDCEGHEVGEDHMDALIDYLVINRGNPTGR